jgi:hypothetical protein
MNTVNDNIKRTWTKGISIESNITIDIWDSGSYKYERWPDGDVCWKVISRELTPTGFSEVLKKMPEWFSPGQVLHWAQVPLLLQGSSQFQLGQWSVAVETQVQAQAEVKPQPQAEVKPQPQAQVKPQALPQAQGRPQAQAKPLQGSEKMVAKGGRKQGQEGHMRREAQGGVVVRGIPLKRSPLREPEPQMKVQIQPQKLQQLQGHPQKPLPRLINQK